MAERHTVTSWHRPRGGPPAWIKVKGPQTLESPVKFKSYIWIVADGRLSETEDNAESGAWAQSSRKRRRDQSDPVGFFPPHASRDTRPGPLRGLRWAVAPAQLVREKVGARDPAGPPNRAAASLVRSHARGDSSASATRHFPPPQGQQGMVLKALGSWHSGRSLKRKEGTRSPETGLLSTFARPPPEVRVEREESHYGGHW
ncbi:uncharacterized protein LOC128591319 [Nycticebus coucang]|uniref:uncharacterized protein LOC128591319 n=1 Tax=Nycticebus coucang TaxID=9470 RepID=UPI00234C3DFB|nr:uncharacterized protein LOC128591319 [Nycticebus coucang]